MLSGGTRKICMTYVDTCFIGWNCSLQILHNLSQRQVRNYCRWSRYITWNSSQEISRAVGVSLGLVFKVMILQTCCRSWPNVYKALRSHETVSGSRFPSLAKGTVRPLRPPGSYTHQQNMCKQVGLHLHFDCCMFDKCVIDCLSRWAIAFQRPRFCNNAFTAATSLLAIYHYEPQYKARLYINI